jgi:hypothetical protein
MALSTRVGADETLLFLDRFMGDGLAPCQRKEPGMRSTDVNRNVPIFVIVAPGRTEYITAAFHYRRQDPFAVRMTFPAHACRAVKDVSWYFARELLADGLRGPSGAGDVHISPLGRHGVVIELRTSGGLAVIGAPMRALRAFLNRSYRLVQPGGESSCLSFEPVLSELRGTS